MRQLLIGTAAQHTHKENHPRVNLINSLQIPDLVRSLDYLPHSLKFNNKIDIDAYLDEIRSNPLLNDIGGVTLSTLYLHTEAPSTWIFDPARDESDPFKPSPAIEQMFTAYVRSKLTPTLYEDIHNIVNRYSGTLGLPPRPPKREGFETYTLETAIESINARMQKLLGLTPGKHYLLQPDITPIASTEALQRTLTRIREKLNIGQDDEAKQILIGKLEIELDGLFLRYQSIVASMGPALNHFLKCLVHLYFNTESTHNHIRNIFFIPVYNNTPGSPEPRYVLQMAFAFETLDTPRRKPLYHANSGSELISPRISTLARILDYFVQNLEIQASSLIQGVTAARTLIQAGAIAQLTHNLGHPARHMLNEVSLIVQGESDPVTRNKLKAASEPLSQFTLSIFKRLAFQSATVGGRRIWYSPISVTTLVKDLLVKATRDHIVRSEIQPQLQLLFPTHYASPTEASGLFTIVEPDIVPRAVVSSPLGSLGRNALAAIIENLARNMAKHPDPELLHSALKQYHDQPWMAPCSIRIFVDDIWVTPAVKYNGSFIDRKSFSPKMYVRLRLHCNLSQKSSAKTLNGFLRAFNAVLSRREGLDTAFRSSKGIKDIAVNSLMLSGIDPFSLISYSPWSARRPSSSPAKGSKLLSCEFLNASDVFECKGDPDSLSEVVFTTYLRRIVQYLIVTSDEHSLDPDNNKATGCEVVFENAMTALEPGTFSTFSLNELETSGPVEARYILATFQRTDDLGRRLRSCDLRASRVLFDVKQNRDKEPKNPAHASGLMNILIADSMVRTGIGGQRLLVLLLDCYVEEWVERDLPKVRFVRIERGASWPLEILDYSSVIVVDHAAEYGVGELEALSTFTRYCYEGFEDGTPFRLVATAESPTPSDHEEIAEYIDSCLQRIVVVDERLQAMVSGGAFPANQRSGFGKVSKLWGLGDSWSLQGTTVLCPTLKGLEELLGWVASQVRVDYLALHQGWLKNIRTRWAEEQDRLGRSVSLRDFACGLRELFASDETRLVVFSEAVDWEFVAELECVAIDYSSLEEVILRGSKRDLSNLMASAARF